MSFVDALIERAQQAEAERAARTSGESTYAPTNQPMSATNNPYADSRAAAQQLLVARNARMTPRPFEATGQPEWARGSASWGRYSQPIAQQIQQQNQGRQNIAALMATPTSINQRYLNNPGPSLRTAGGLSPQMPRSAPQYVPPAQVPTVRAHSVSATTPIPGETIAQQAVRQHGYYHPSVHAAMQPANPIVPTPPTNPNLIPLNPVNISQAQTAQDAQRMMVANRLLAAENRRRTLGY
jgi:hypothetical protein